MKRLRAHPLLSRNYTNPQKPRYASARMVKHKKDFSGVVKVVSYNIHFARKINSAIKLFEKNEDLICADIVCLQEMDHKGVEKIAHALKFNYVYYPAVFHPRYSRDFGNAILSKWPIKEDKKIILPNARRQRLQRIAVCAEVHINDMPIMVFCVHMKVFLKPNHRSDQVDSMLQHIPAHIQHCIIAGDFNTYSKTNRRAIYDPLVDADFQLASKDVGWTFKHWYFLNKKNWLDHIYTRGLHVVKSGKVVDHKPSDHIPIWVEVK